MSDIPERKQAQTALKSAKLLFDAGDFNGAADRAYYAMHGIARVLFAKQGLPVPKTHNGMHTKFGEEFIVGGKIESEMGRYLHRVENIRLIADYSADNVTEENAKLAIEYAEKFVTRIDQYITNF